MSLYAKIYIAWIALCSLAYAENRLPCFLADNHGETVSWVSRNFDLDEPYTLVLVDAHSDASAAERSEEMREEIRRVASEKARKEKMSSWQKGGRLQAFNWIEPLMPRPFDQVFWLASSKLKAGQAAELSHEATSFLDGRLEMEPRSAGSFLSRWQTFDLQGFLEWKPGSRNIIASIDLDFFAGMDASTREASFESIWQRAMDWPGLVGVSFAISRPWLLSDKEADELISLVLERISCTRGATLELHALPDLRPDFSKKARESGYAVPRWSLAQASLRNRHKLMDLGDRVSIYGADNSWREGIETATITPDHGEIDCDKVWRYLIGREPILRVNARQESSGRTRWYRLEAVRNAYDIIPETGLGKVFAREAGRWIYHKRISLGETKDFQLHPSVWRNEVGGRFLIEAEYETKSGWLPVSVIELRIRSCEGFRGSLSECMGMPYVFGITAVQDGELSGVETGWGSDCANLLIHAWRRNGLQLKWGDPSHLRKQLFAKAKSATTRDLVEISNKEIEAGVAIDFGNHVAALFQDLEPYEKIDGNDLIFHHLGGTPEIIRLDKLTATCPIFSVYSFAPKSQSHLVFGGDVVMAGDDRVALEGFSKSSADLFVVNLEGIPSMLPPSGNLKFDFRFSPELLSWLMECGVDAVSLANNHAFDAGAEGLMDGIRALDEIGIASFGAGANQEAACQPLRLEIKGNKIALFGVSFFGIGAAGEKSPGVAVLPLHSGLLESEFATSRKRKEKIIVMVHGGDEYSSLVNDEQRHWARWLVARGAKYIIGAHPHLVQRTEYHGGAAIMHSLGNAVYPRHLKGLGSGEMRVISIGD